MQKKQHRLKKRKHTRLPMHVYLSYLFVVALIFTGVTFSKYITSADSGDSARVAKFGNLTMEEENKPEKFIITPGVDIAKNPQVSFGAEKPSEMAVYVFVSVDASGWSYDEDKSKYQILKETEDAEDKEQLSWSVDHAWTFLKTDGGKQIFYRTVPVGETLNNVSVIADGIITVSPHLYHSEYGELNAAMKSITFNAYAIQMQGTESAQSAWSSVSGK